jgi:hypothetical protein
MTLERHTGFGNMMQALIEEEAAIEWYSPIGGGAGDSGREKLNFGQLEVAWRSW